MFDPTVYFLITLITICYWFTTLRPLPLHSIPSYTVCLQMNVAVLKVNKKFISHLTWAKHTPSAVATVLVSYMLITILQCVHPGSTQ